MYVIAPELQTDDRGRLPHVWDDGSLCLSAAGEWKPSYFYVDTVIPWASEWLFFYELWKATGIWMGDEDGTVGKGTDSVLYRYDGWTRARQQNKSKKCHPMLNKIS